MSDLLDAALDYSRRGFSVVPILPKDKKPLVPWEDYQRRKATQEELQTWWAKWPDINLGIITGQISRVIVIDIDSPEARERLKELCQGYDLTAVPRSRTGKGWHLWFKHPGVSIPNRAGVLPGVDIRGDGGFVVAPPSIHSSGKTYRWEVPLASEVPELPPELLNLILQPRETATTQAPGDLIREGERNATLTSLAGTMRKRGMTEEAILAALLEENQRRCGPPLPQREVADIAHSVSRYAPQAEGDTAQVSPKSGFNLVAAKDLLSTREDCPDWLWEGILPSGGLSLVVAKPKVGKTTMALNLAVAVSRGADFLGRKTRQGPVVYLALEEKRSEVKQKLEDLGITGEPIYFHFGPAPQEAMKQVGPLIKDTEAILLVADVLQKFCRVKDLNDYAQVTRALEPLMTTARETECHVLLTHHAGKADRADGDDILGSTGLLGGVDTSIHIKKREQRRTFFTIQRYGEDIPETVISLRPDGSLEAMGSRQEVEITETMPLILDALAEPLTEKGIWQRIERDHSLIAKALRLLVAQEKVERTGTGKRGDPYIYRKALLLSSHIYEESKRETKMAPKSLSDKGKSSLEDFSEMEGWEEV